MKNDNPGRDLMVVNAPATGWARWIPTFVVTGVITGFLALAWYAYHTGMQSMREEDLLVVEADKTPIKEKPVDPGGMQFPNQDKTIFDTFAGRAHQPPKVERVLPMPEEPLPKNADMSETTSWVNDKTAKQPLPKPEQLFDRDAKPAPAPAPAPVHQEMAAVAPPPADESETYIAPPKPDAKTEAKPEVKAEPKPVPPPVAAKPAEVPAKPAPEKKETPKPTVTMFDHAKAESGGGAYQVQLGAYRSEKEAQDAWSKLQKKQSALAGKVPLIIKADLGSKGIYYRLRVGGLASSAEAKSFCGSLKGQACILPTGK